MRGLMMAGALALMAGGAEAAIYRYDFTSTVTPVDAGSPPGFEVTASITIDVNAFPEKLRSISVILDDEFLVNSSRSEDSLGPDNYVFRDVSISLIDPFIPEAGPIIIDDPRKISLGLRFDEAGKGIVVRGSFDTQFNGGAFGNVFVIIGSTETLFFTGSSIYRGGAWDVTRTYLGPTPPALVPVPAGLPLLALGVLAVAGLGRRVTPAPAHRLP